MNSSFNDFGLFPNFYSINTPSERPISPDSVVPPFSFSVYRSDLNNGGYRTIRHIDDDANNKEYSALDETANTGGYGNRAYDRAADLSGLEQRGARIRRRGSESEEEELYRMNANPNHGANVNTSHLTRYPIDPPPVPRRNSWHEHETYEEEFKEEIEYGRSAASSRGSSRERLNKL